LQATDNQADKAKTKSNQQSCGATATQAGKSTDESTAKQNQEEFAPNIKPLRKVEERYGRDNLHRILSQEEISIYDEFLEPSETRFSKTNIFTNYKEFHNRRNIQELDRSKDKKFFTKQLRIVNKEKQIDKRIPCWASDVDLIQKVQNIQNKLIDQKLLTDELMFANDQ
jgi:hypothetical protein